MSDAPENTEGREHARMIRLSDLQAAESARQSGSDQPQQDPSEPRWYILVDDIQTGPFSAAELIEQAQTGELKNDTPVWMEGGDVIEWTDAGNFHFLRDAISAARNDNQTMKMRPVRLPAPPTASPSPRDLPAAPAVRKVPSPPEPLRPPVPQPEQAVAEPAHAPPSESAEPQSEKAQGSWRRFAGVCVLIVATGPVVVFLLTQFGGTPKEDPKARAVEEKPATLTPDELFKRASPSVVTVVVEDAQGRKGNGSGFVVNNRGMIATNHHVVRRAHSAYILLADKSRVPVLGALAVDEDADIAIIKVQADQLSVPPLRLGGDELPPVGSKTYAIGSPYGLVQTLTDGLISAHRDEGALHGGNRVRMIQMTTPISPGNSGGPLLSANGTVIGVNTLSKTGAQNVNFAVPVSEVTRLLKASEDDGVVTRFPLPPKAPPKAANTKGLAAQLRVGLTATELDRIVGRVPDKTGAYPDGAFIPEFGMRAEVDSYVRCYFPLERRPGKEQLYILNCLLEESSRNSDSRRLLKKWYFRVPQ
jgi:S1-C subfamily serine protease